MANQTFRLLGSRNEDLGIISKNEDGKMIMVLNGFFGSIVSKKMKLTNVDDFVGSLFFGDKTTSAVVECENCGSENLTVYFNSKTHSDLVEVNIYIPVIGKIFTAHVKNVEDVTGKVFL